MSRITLPKLKNVLSGGTIAVGFAAMVCGVAQIYGPAGWIVAGIGIILAGLPIW